jgi:hypothetical protein
LKRALACLLLGAVVTAAAQNTNEPRIQGGKSDWEIEQERRNLTEGDVKLPAYPAAENLIEFFVSGSSSFRFFVDAASLARGADGVIRYTMVARSASGVSNVSYEGIRCATGSYKIYAYGNDGRWTARDSEWREIEPKSVQRWHNELQKNYFCLNGSMILSTEEGLNALRRGGHPGTGVRVGF